MWNGSLLLGNIVNKNLLINIYLGRFLLENDKTRKITTDLHNLVFLAIHSYFQVKCFCWTGSSTEPSSPSVSRCCPSRTGTRRTGSIPWSTFFPGTGCPLYCGSKFLTKHNLMWKKSCYALLYNGDLLNLLL